MSDQWRESSGEGEEVEESLEATAALRSAVMLCRQKRKKREEKFEGEKLG